MPDKYVDLSVKRESPSKLFERFKERSYKQKNVAKRKILTNMPPLPNMRSSKINRQYTRSPEPFEEAPPRFTMRKSYAGTIANVLPMTRIGTLAMRSGLRESPVPYNMETPKACFTYAETALNKGFIPHTPVTRSGRLYDRRMTSPKPGEA